MQHYPPDNLFKLTAVVDRRPLTYDVTTSVQQAINTLAEAQKSCLLPGLELSLNTVLSTQARGNSIWVTDQGQLLGQFTEAEALRAIVAGTGEQPTPISAAMVPPADPMIWNQEADDDLRSVINALGYLRQQRSNHVPVLDASGQFIGVINPQGIRNALQPDELLKSSTLGEVMQSNLLMAPVGISVFTLAQLMAQHSQDTVILTGDDRTPLGLITRADILQLYRLGLDLSNFPAEAVMQAPPLKLSATQSALEGHWVMQQQPTQHCLVVSSEKIAGIVTPTSFLYALQMQDIQQNALEVQRSIAYSKTVIPSPDLEAVSQSSLNQMEWSGLLSTMALHIRESLDLRTILETAVDEVRQFLDCDRVLIYRFNRDMSGTVVVESTADGWRPTLESTVQDTCFGQNYAQAYKKGRIQVVDDIYLAGLSQCHIDILVLFDVRASLVVPILQGKYLWGLLCAYQCDGPRHWRDFEIDMLKQLATHMAIAIQQSELYRQVNRELCDRKRAEDELKASLREKESLLKEIHHRVKNNLQIISSVLRLQSDYIHDEKVLDLFNDSQHRIRSMALIHEKLYKSQDLTRIFMDDYIRDLATSLLSSHHALVRNIQLEVHADDIYLNIDTAIPCGLIINELVSNALKHAFPPRHAEERHAEENKIEVTIFPQYANTYSLTVKDNGIGFPADLDFRNTDSLGLELVCVFTEQLEGSIDLERAQGTTFTVTFTQLNDL